MDNIKEAITQTIIIIAITKDTRAEKGLTQMEIIIAKIIVITITITVIIILTTKTGKRSKLKLKQVKLNIL